MGAATTYNVRVRKSYTEVVQVLAITGAEAYAEARKLPGVMMIEKVALADYWEEEDDND